MLRPSPHLKNLIAAATPLQQQRAVDYARHHLVICKKLGVEPSPPEKIMTEALEIVMAEMPLEDEALLRARHDFYMRRTYSATYSEP
jgi:hypothetical protein